MGSPSDALQLINKQRSQQIKAESQKQSTQFVTDLKNATLFQVNWSELLGAAPAALSFMGSCWVAAAEPAADTIVLTKSVPTGGFRYITNRPDPTLRSILVDVCNNGGKMAFKKASTNMISLRRFSYELHEHRITEVFSLLSRCTKSADDLEDFQDALNRFASDANECARLATEVREAFARWGMMVGELHAASEQQVGRTSIEKSDLEVEKNMAKIDKKFALEASASAKEVVETMVKHFDKAEARLDDALEKVPSAWESCIQGAITGFVQALPSVMAAAVPMVMASVNPVGTAAAGATGAVGQLAAAAAGGAAAGTNTAAAAAAATAAADTTAKQPPPAANPPPAKQKFTAAKMASDPAYTTASELKPLVDSFYEYLGGEKGDPDWPKFDDGTAYLTATLVNQKNKLDNTGTPPYQKVVGEIDKLSKTVDEIATYRKENKNELTAAKNPPVNTLIAWKTTVVISRNSLLEIASSSITQGGGNMPMVIPPVNIPPPDLSAQTAQMSTAMQAVQLAQNAIEVAQNGYEAALKRQADNAKAMALVEKKLKKLKEKGKTLDNIKTVLRSCIAVLVDLTIQIGKIEQFFTMLTQVINDIVKPTAARFMRDMGTVGARGERDKYIHVNDLLKQVIYSSTLQLKAYFSLLEDIAKMYTEVDQQYIGKGIELCDKLSAGSAGSTSVDQLANDLHTYSLESSEAVATLVKTRQAEIFDSLKARARRAAENTEVIENTVRSTGLTVDDSAKKAIASGAEIAKQQAVTLLASSTSATMLTVQENKDDDEIDFNDL